MENSILDAVFNGNFKAFKESVSSALYGKIASRIEDAKGEVAKEIFGEEKESDDVEYKERINHSDKNGHPENDEDDEDDDEDDEGKGGEFLVHVKLLDVPDTELENFRVVGTSKADVESKLEKFYGKGKYEVKSIKLSEDVIMEATARSLEKSKYASAHNGGVHYSKIGSKDTEWNYVGKDKSGKNVVIDNRDDAHSILHKGKLLSLYKENEKLGKGDASNGDLDHLFGKTKKVSEETLDEAKVDRDSYKVYHGSYSSAIDEAGEHAKRRGYTHDPEEIASKVGFGPEKPKDGVSNRFSVHLYKDGEKQKRMHHFQVYGMGNGRYELNQYMDPKGRGKQTSNESTLEEGGRFEKGEDIGKPGLNFKKIAKKAGAEYGSEEAGKRVAGSILKKILKKKVANESALESKGPSTLHNINHKGMTAPEMLKAELPLHRHIEKELANHGHEKGTKEYKEKYDNALAYYNRTGAPKVSEDKEKNESVKIGNKPEEMALGGYLKKIGLKAKKANTGPKDVDDAVKETGKVKQMESVNSLQSIAKIAQNIEECSTYKGDYDYKNGDKDKEYATSHESFSDAIEAAKEHAKASGYSHDPEEFNHIVNTGFIKPKDKKTHAFHVSLYDKKDGHEVLNKIHNFQITGSGDGKFSMVSDIK